MPQGPLIVTNITATSRLAGWKPSANNNKVPVDFYEVYYQFRTKNKWQNYALQPYNTCPSILVDSN